MGNRDSVTSKVVMRQAAREVAERHVDALIDREAQLQIRGRDAGA